MRPIRLDLDGFASFRDPAAIDFTDADYFAFVGPTGSGKSTLIDALTFALYGSAPRWGRETSNQYALAPTANRCTVRLVFDVAGERYVVAREVRRSGTAVQQKSCTLERYLDSSATGDVLADEPTESLAGDPRSVKAQVIELLGLEFDDFCTCVVLPQGEFQTFLKATATERQAILLKLIGGRHYDEIGKAAGRQARDAEARVGALTAQLAEYADATEEAAQQAADREAELERLLPMVEEAVTGMRDLLARQGATAGVVEKLTAEVALLEAIRPPGDIDEIQAGLAAALAAYRSAQEREARARAAAAQAQRAVETGPQRGPLEEALRHDAERAECVARLPALEAAVDLTEVDRARTALAARTAEEQVEQLRRDHAAALATADRAAAAVQEVQDRIATYADVAVPVGLAELADRSTAAQRRHTQAETDVADATSALEAAGATLTALPERSALEELDRALTAYGESLTEESELVAGSESLGDQLERAGDRASAAAAQRDTAREQLDRLRARSVAADLRPGLHVGEPCPVCDQTVAVLPPALSAPELDAARRALATVEQELADALDERQQAETRRAALRAELAAVRGRLEQLEQIIAARLGPEEGRRRTLADREAFEALRRQFDGATVAHRAAAERLAASRHALQAAVSEEALIRSASERHRAELHATLGRLKHDGLPDLDPTDLRSAWTALARWAERITAALRDNDLVAAGRAFAAARTTQDESALRLTAGQQSERTGREAATASALAAQQARLERDRLVSRVAELEALLADQPEPVELRRLLTECDRLAAAEHEARRAVDAAGLARAGAERDHDARRTAEESARRQLLSAREPVIGLGAPPTTDDLAASWAALTGWARDAGSARRDALTRCRAESAEAAERLTGQVAELTALCEAHGIDGPVELRPAGLGAGLMERLPAAVLVERERARARSAEIARRRNEADRLRHRITQEIETQQVAALLSSLMTSRKFPQWLADTALDTLVVDASASLMRLSGGQFDLTHDRGEFFVIDHADADSRRSVRTLSGGETFQASLALALALSEQLSALAAGGRTTLDSIFLDEGFGTLDPDALEVVAGTLENLAQDDRMVGVVTHVQALAERVPVRYVVARDSRSSSVQRVGP